MTTRQNSKERSMEPTTGGSGEVHAHIASQPDKGEGMSGKFDRDSTARDLGRRVRQGAEDAFDSMRDRSGDLRERVGGAAHRARDRAGQFFDEAEERIGDHSGVLTTARHNPLAALGIAFAVGFLLAGDSDEPERHPSLAKAKNQVKGAIMGGISAAISQQLRTFIEEQGGIGTLLASLGVPVPGGRDQPYFTPDDELHDA
jgi:ElaB/YqjD/DUF883 family membrane-anchored ribosome-binding protein